MVVNPNSYMSFKRQLPSPCLFQLTYVLVLGFQAKAWTSAKTFFLVDHHQDAEADNGGSLIYLPCCLLPIPEIWLTVSDNKIVWTEMCRFRLVVLENIQITGPRSSLRVLQFT